jgi:exosortase family protein XrtM
MVVQKKHEAVRFILFFLSLFASFQLVWFLSSKKIEPFISEILHVKVIYHIISILTPGIPISVSGVNIMFSHFSLSIDSACNGLGPILMVVSAVIALPSDIKRKIIGSLSGCLFLYLFNVSRIVVLFYSRVFAPGLFDYLHVYAGQTLAILAGVGFFFFWASRAASGKYETSCPLYDNKG